MCLFLYKTGDTSPGLIRLAFSNILVVAFNMGLRYAFAVGEEGGGGKFGKSIEARFSTR